MPKIPNDMLQGSYFYLGIALFVSVLFHWIDLYHVSISTLKQEQMLQKINANYKGVQITVEDIVAKVTFLKKLRLPFIICVLVIAVFQWLTSILAPYGVYLVLYFDAFFCL